MKNFRLRGLLPATFTPMHPDGSLNLGAVAPAVEQMLADGASGLYVCGSTGEGVSLSSDERKATAQAFITAADGRVPVVVQVGHNSLAEARQLAAHAQAAGADAISATPPTYFRPSGIDNLIDCLAHITAGAPELPFYYYHIPGRTGVALDLPGFLAAAGERLPTLAGAKYSDFTIFDLQVSVDMQEGRFDLLFGSDEMLLSALAVGVQGAVGTTYTFAAPLYSRILAAFAAGEMAEARRLQGLAVGMVRVGVRHGGLPAFKAMMGLVGQECGPMRLPWRGLSVGETDALRRDLDAIGFFDWGRS